MQKEASQNDISSWLRRASILHRLIESARFDMDKEFPRREYLQPLDKVSADLHNRLICFLNFDTSQLLPKIELETLLAKAKEKGISKGNILHSELLKIHAKTRDLKITISQFAASAVKSYSEAKSIFAELLKQGIWMEEAEAVKKTITVNKSIEQYLSESDLVCLSGLKEIKENDGRFIDPTLKQAIAIRFPEINNFRRKIDQLLQKQALEFSDFEMIEKLVKECRNFSYFVPNFDFLMNLQKSFLWTLQLAIKFSLKSQNLDMLVKQLKTLIIKAKERGMLKDKKEILLEASNISYSQPPIKDLVQDCRFLMWDEEIQSYLQRPLYKNEELKSLIERAPNEESQSHGGNQDFHTLKALYERAKNWVAQVEIISRQTQELRTSTGEVFTRRMNTSMHQIEEVIAKAHEEYRRGLNKIEELQALKSKLDVSERTLIMSKCVHSYQIKTKIEHSDYMKAKELFKEKNEKFHQSPLFKEFKSLLKKFNDEVRLLKDVYFKIMSKEVHATPDLYEPKFIVYAKDLNKAEAALDAITKVEDYIYLGDFGTIIRNFIIDFKKAESSLVTLIKEYPSTELVTFDIQKIQDVSEDFSKRKQKWRIRLYSDYLEELSRYEWLLAALICLKSDQAPFEMVERLLTCSEVAIQDDRLVVKQLQQKVIKGKELIETVQNILSSTGPLTVDDLKSVKRQLDQSNVVVKALNKQIDNEYHSYEMIEHDFNMAKNPPVNGQINSLEDLRVLLKDACSLKYKAPEIEKKLMEAIHSSEHLLKFVDQGSPIEEITKYIDQYKEAGLFVREVEIVLRNRQIALDYLKNEQLNIDLMSQRELKLIEKCINNSLDPGFKEKLGNRILKRKFNLLVALEKKDQEAGEENKIKIGELKEICDQMRSRPGLFTNDEMELIQEKLNQSNIYVEQMKKLKEETLKKCMKVLFNYLDITDQIKQIEKAFHPVTSTLEKLVKPDKPKGREHHKEPSTVQDEEVQEIGERNERRERRKEEIRSIRKTIMKNYQGLEKEEASEFGKLIEAKINSQCKYSLADYLTRIDDYKKLISKFHERPFMIELIITKPISRALVEFLLEDDSLELRGLTDIIQARRYLRLVERKIAEGKEIEERGGYLHESNSKSVVVQDASLGKRSAIKPFLEEELEVLAAAQKRMKDRSGQKGAFISINDSISLDTPDKRRNYFFVERAEEISDSDDEQTESRDLSSCSINNSMSNEGSSVQDLKKTQNGLRQNGLSTNLGPRLALAADDLENGNIVERRECMVQEKLDISDGKVMERMLVENYEHITSGSKKEQTFSRSSDGGDEPISEFRTNQKEEHSEKIEPMATELLGADESNSVIGKPSRKNTSERNHEQVQSDINQDQSQSDLLGMWEIFQGTFMFESLKKGVAHQRLVSLTSHGNASQIPIFGKTTISFEEQKSLKVFEREMDRVKMEVLKQNTRVVSGFIHSDPKMAKLLAEIKQTKNSIYFSSITSGVRLYLLGMKEMGPTVKFMFEDLDELLRINCEFLWLLVIETDTGNDKKVIPKQFIDQLDYKESKKNHGLTEESERERKTTQEKNTPDIKLGNTSETSPPSGRIKDGLRFSNA